MILKIVEFKFPGKKCKLQKCSQINLTMRKLKTKALNGNDSQNEKPINYFSHT